jgi:chromosome segregation ATPase
MPSIVSHDQDQIQRRLQRLEHRYRRLGNLLASAQAAYASLSELPGAHSQQLDLALQRVQRTQRELLSVQNAIDGCEDELSATW